MPPKILVIAGNYEQYINYLHEQGISPRDAVYVHDRESACGYHMHGDNKVVHVGTWWENPIYRCDSLGSETEQFIRGGIH